MDSSNALEEEALAAALRAELSRKRKRTPILNAAPPPIKHAFFKDRVTPITIFPIPPGFRLPESLLLKLCTEFNRELERGTTFPFTEPMSLPQFQAYWFSNHAAVMLKGKDEILLREGRDWDAECVGTFLVFPRFPGRSSHICTGQFLICDGFRGKGAGKVLVSTFLDHATKLGYSSALFDLIYETNESMLNILDSQGFKRAGVIKAAGNLVGHSDPVDSIILSRDLVDEEDFQSNERFEKIRYYLEKGKYPPFATRSEKSRLRSAATHYRLAGDKLMLKGKEVISDPQTQFEIAREVHRASHGGINKTTAQIADKYHWIQIKKTVNQVLRNCMECTQNSRPPVVKAHTPTDKGKGEGGENLASVSAERRTRNHPRDNDDDDHRHHHNDNADADAEIDDETVMSIPSIPTSEAILDIPSPLSHSHPHTHRAIKSPPGLHHHQLAQSIRLQHDAMSLSQRAQAAAAVESGFGDVSALAAAGLQSNLPVDPAMMDDEMVRHIHAIHQQQQQHRHHHHHAGETDAMDDMNIMSNFEFDESDLHLIGGSRSDGAPVVMDEAERRRHARETALMAVAAIRGATAGAGAGQPDDGGDGGIILEPFE
ncbi:hypothetical protein DRE_05445 [Drechslerella stenobrocha 248]|uniref:Zinc finger H2C2-type histone UAS binding domain-containing protein n=1 Tax=Drechslerella stenobrocha 248 TaxID=1043628 RepID=W7HZF3_9PEZI|nr:hypothetical protein DRE_05445 [Drechslerella stenobrocha 248]